MAANLVQVKAEPQLLLDGWVILTSGTKQRWREIEDIVSWVEAFMLFAMVLTLFFPHRWWDLKVYKLLLLCTYCQFARRVWLTYNKAFTEHAAATKLTDWSPINVQLYNFHAAGPSAHSSSETEFPQSMEAIGSSAAMFVATLGTGANVLRPTLRASTLVIALTVQATTRPSPVLVILGLSLLAIRAHPLPLVIRSNLGETNEPCYSVYVTL